MPSTSGRASVTPLSARFAARHACGATASSVLFALALGVAAPAIAQSGAGAPTFDGPKVVPDGVQRRLEQAAADWRPGPSRPSPSRLLRTACAHQVGGSPTASAPSAPGRRAAADAAHDPEFPGPEFHRQLRWHAMRRRLAARPQRRSRSQPLHRGRQHGVRDLQQDGHAARVVFRGPLWARRGANHCNGNSRAIRSWSTTRSPTAGSSRTSRSVNAAAPMLPVHRGLEDERSGRRRLVALPAADRHRRAPGSRRSSSLNDYPKFGAWHDCLYMSANQFAFHDRQLPGRRRSRRSAAPISTTAIR